MKEKMEKGVQQVKEAVGSVQGKMQALMPNWKVLNVTPDSHPKAEELLLKSEMLEPALAGEPQTS